MNLLVFNPSRVAVTLAGSPPIEGNDRRRDVAALLASSQVPVPSRLALHGGTWDESGNPLEG